MNVSMTITLVHAWIVSRFQQLHREDPDRGDVPGWVLVTLMTAGLVVGLWALAGPRFEALFTQAMDTVVGQL